MTTTTASPVTLSKLVSRHEVAERTTTFRFEKPSNLLLLLQRPAKPDETILLYGVGFGLPTTPLTNGSTTQSGSLPAFPVCTLGGAPEAAAVFGLWLLQKRDGSTSDSSEQIRPTTRLRNRMTPENLPTPSKCASTPARSTSWSTGSWCTRSRRLGRWRRPTASTASASITCSNCTSTALGCRSRTRRLWSVSTGAIPMLLLVGLIQGGIA
jgi:hypothetical protein